MKSPQLAHVAGIYGFLSSAIKLIETKLHTKRNPRVLTLPCSYSFQLDHMTSVYGFIFTVVNPITTRLGRIADQHTLILPCRWR